MKREIPPTIGARVEERPGASPIFTRGEDVECHGDNVGDSRSVELPANGAGDWVSLRAIRKWEQVYGSVEAADGISCLPWHCVAVVDTRPPSTCGGDEHAVESSSATFIRIETIENELAQNPRALRIAKANRPLNRPYRAERRDGREILESTCHVPKRGKAQPGNLWLLTHIYKFVRKVRLKAARKLDGAGASVPGCTGRA
jgi:hypothetical protein